MVTHTVRHIVIGAAAPTSRITAFDPVRNRGNRRSRV